ncbi:hypothetical protein DOY81_012762, partial [Sarcophaga bullata]
APISIPPPPPSTPFATATVSTGKAICTSSTSSTSPTSSSPPRSWPCTSTHTIRIIALVAATTLFCPSATLNVNITTSCCYCSSISNRIYYIICYIISNIIYIIFIIIIIKFTICSSSNKKSKRGDVYFKLF